VRRRGTRDGRCRRGWSLAALAHLAAAGGAGAQAAFVPMGSVPAGWDRVSHVMRVTNDGVVIGNVLRVVGGAYLVYQGFTWDAQNGFTLLGALDPERSSIVGYASPDGRVIPGAAIDHTGKYVAVVWVDGVGPERIGAVPEGFSATAWGVSWDGTVVGGELFTPGLLAEGWLWSLERGFEALGVPPGASYTTVVQLPQHGDVVLSAIIWGSLGGAQEGARWTRAKGWEPLGDLPGGDFFSNLGLCSRDGRVGAGRASPPTGTTHMARWTDAGGWQDLGGAGWSAGISGDGWTVVGISGSTSTGNLAAMWDPGEGLRFVQDVLEKEFGLNLSGWKLREAHAISDNGRYIAGIGHNPQGKLEGWLVEMPPFCYADCDRSSGKGNLDVFDFLCFINKFNARDPYGNCDNDGAFDLFDFLCFINHFTAGCQP